MNEYAETIDLIIKTFKLQSKEIDRIVEELKAVDNILILIKKRFNVIELRLNAIELKLIESEKRASPIH